MYYTWVYSDGKNYAVVEHDDSVSKGWTREIAETDVSNNKSYQDWIAAGNIPQKVAGSLFVTVDEKGTVTYDSIRAAAAATASTWKQVRAQRDGLIEVILWRAERYERQKSAGLPTNDTETQYLEVLLYIQGLRDITKQADPYKIEWPVMPK